MSFEFLIRLPVGYQAGQSANRESDGYQATGCARQLAGQAAEHPGRFPCNVGTKLKTTTPDPALSPLYPEGSGPTIYNTPMPDTQRMNMLSEIVRIAPSSHSFQAPYRER